MPQITGKFINRQNKVEGEKNGRPWARIQFAVLTMDDSSRMVAFDVFGEDKVAAVEQLAVGSVVVVEYYPESREHDGRYFTNLNCRRILQTQNLDVSLVDERG